MTALAPGPLSTLSYAAVITWKQVDVLLFLLDDEENYPGKPRTTRDVSDFLTEIKEEHLACGEQIYYWGTSYSATYATLKGLEQRGLVYRRQWDDRWHITRKGMRAYDQSFNN